MIGANTSKLIWFVIKSRARLMLTGPENNVSNVARVFVLLGLILYASFFAFVLRFVDDSVNIDLISYALLSSLAAFLIINQNFPSLKMPSEIIKPYFPLNYQNRVLINLLYDLFRPTILYIFFFLLFFSMITPEPGWWFFIDGILTVVGLVCLDFSFKLFITKKNKYTISILILLGISIGVLSGYFLAAFFDIYSNYYTGTLLITSWFAGNLILYTFTMVQSEEPAIEETTNQHTVVKSVGKVSRIIYNRNSNTWPTYIFIVAFNALVAIYIYFFRFTMPDPLIDVYSYFLIFPIIPFTFVHNNLYGFMRTVWLETQFRNVKKLTPFKIYIGSLFPVVLLDVTVSFAALYAIGMYHWHYIILFLIALAIMIPTGIWSTVRFSRVVKSIQISSFQNNTSSRISFLIVTLLSIIGVLFFYVDFWFGIGIGLISSAVFTFLAIRKNSTRKYQMYKNLYST